MANPAPEIDRSQLTHYWDLCDLLGLRPARHPDTAERARVLNIAAQRANRLNLTVLLEMAATGALPPGRPETL